MSGTNIKNVKNGKTVKKLDGLKVKIQYTYNMKYSLLQMNTSTMAWARKQPKQKYKIIQSRK